MTLCRDAAQIPMLYIGVFLASMGFPALDNVVKEKV